VVIRFRIQPQLVLFLEIFSKCFNSVVAVEFCRLYYSTKSFVVYIFLRFNWNCMGGDEGIEESAWLFLTEHLFCCCYIITYEYKHLLQ
jgi:hypothetical protein